MESNVESKKDSSKKNKKWLLLLLLLLLIMAAAGGCFFLTMQDKEEENSSDGLLGYESSAVAVSDEEELQKLVDGMLEMTKDGQMSLEYKNVATSNDGKNFNCYIANSLKNKYDMYLGIYSDITLEEELFLTQLLQPGTGIEKFETEERLEPGTYDVILVFTQVKDDHQTIQSQVFVTYALTVAE